MNFTAAIDISTFIWCENDYENNKNQYYKLLAVIPTIYESIKFFKIPVLIRREFYDQIMIDFPYNMAKEISCEFENLTLSFLTNIDWSPYIENNDNTITSVPSLAKQYFNNLIQTEMQSQIVHLFQNSKNPEHKFISYKYFFNQNNNLLVLNQQQNTVEIDTLCYDSEQEIRDFFERNRIKFGHNTKHKAYVRYANGEKISPFTCFHQKNGQVKAQKLLEEAFLYQDDYYNFDKDNNVYVKYVLTGGLTYHGFDLSDDNNNVPNEIKKKFNKNGKIF